jgi:hypothetical protein
MVPTLTELMIEVVEITYLQNPGGGKRNTHHGK